MKLLDIGEVSERTGIPPSTLRYYDELGLIDSVGRHGLRRQFGPEAIWQLSLILLGKKAGFSLDEIGAVFGKDAATELPRPRLQARADEIDQQIHDLAVLRDAIRHVAACPAPSHMECPRFRKLLRVAGRRTRPKG
ncbi:helix-turn-helix domain-containing protein [Nitratireductor mangrovi]|uniref:Helix-turn-helix domain-containing protein n=1 Tax=Nitratireductor mangrovi TaxID=2599600 RepID=A0A5B8KZM4_9HYPH|nr:helix-turn-helix domain-containing protein [Nitratireductor mangrovi]QDZ00890.1 helix-turn-helix domain-containing protein [Nitratireductor mangrovi]